MYIGSNMASIGGAGSKGGDETPQNSDNSNPEISLVAVQSSSSFLSSTSTTSVDKGSAFGGKVKKEVHCKHRSNMDTVLANSSTAAVPQAPSTWTEYQNMVRSSKENEGATTPVLLEGVVRGTQDNNTSISGINLSSFSSNVGANETDAAIPALAASLTTAAAHCDDVIDPALLSALRDGRERRNLLKLEQTMIELCRKNSSMHLDVLPYSYYQNSNNAIGGMNNGQSGGGFGNNGGVGGGGTMNGNSGFRMQTSFQRLCLHRLADRFGIIRENILGHPGGNGEMHSNANTSGIMGGNNVGIVPNVAGATTSTGCVVNYGGSYGAYFVPQQQQQQQQQQHTMNTIRLVKTRDSRIPSPLLIDLDCQHGDAVQNGVNNGDSACGAVGSGSGQWYRGENSGNTASDGMAAMKETTQDMIKSLSGLSLNNDTMNGSNHSSANINVAGKQTKQRRPKIMKRGGKDDKNKKGVGEKAGGKKKKRLALSERERAYAEARARIFGTDVVEGDVNAVVAGDPALVEGAVNTSSPSSNVISAPHTTLNFATPDCSISSAVADTATEVRTSSPNKTAPSTTASASPSPPLPHDIDNDAAPSTSTAGNIGVNSNPSISKVTWRNRRMEVNDPDFRRQTAHNTQPYHQYQQHQRVVVVRQPTQQQAHILMHSSPSSQQQQHVLNGVASYVGPMAPSSSAPPAILVGGHNAATYSQPVLFVQQQQQQSNQQQHNSRGHPYVSLQQGGSSYFPSSQQQQQALNFHHHNNQEQQQQHQQHRHSNKQGGYLSYQNGVLVGSEDAISNAAPASSYNNDFPALG